MVSTTLKCTLAFAEMLILDILRGCVQLLHIVYLNSVETAFRGFIFCRFFLFFTPIAQNNSPNVSVLQYHDGQSSSTEAEFDSCITGQLKVVKTLNKSGLQLIPIYRAISKPSLINLISKRRAAGMDDSLKWRL